MEGWSMPAAMERAESSVVAQPQVVERVVFGVQRVCMRDERTAGVRTLESSKW
jgi:hypothetical protein